MVFIRNNIGAGGEFVVHGCVVADVIMGGQEGIFNPGVGWVVRHPSAELQRIRSLNMQRLPISES